MTSRRICFTLNNPTISLSEFADQFEEKYSPRYFICQLEKGENGTPHFQGYAEFPKPLRYAPIAAHFHMHCETAKGKESANTHYCSKPVDNCACQHCVPPPIRLDGPVIRGSTSSSGQGKRSDLYAAVDALREGGIKRVAEDHLEVFLKYSKALHELELLERPKRNTLEVCLYFGPPGGGKTYAAERACEPSWTTPPDWSGSKFWFDGLRRDHASIVIDEFSGQIRLDAFLKILNERAQMVPIKGGHVWLTQSVIYITTNIHPYYWYDWNSREFQYKALSRRIHRVYGFRDYHKYGIDHDTFFNWRRPGLLGLGNSDTVAQDEYELIPMTGQIEEYINLEF